MKHILKQEYGLSSTETEYKQSIVPGLRGRTVQSIDKNKIILTIYDDEKDKVYTAAYKVN